jgi:hypothetical protein
MSSSTKNGAKSLEWTSMILTTLDFVLIGADLSATLFQIQRWGLVIDHLVEVFLHVRTASRELGYLEGSKRAEAYARVAYKVVVGESPSFECVMSLVTLECFPIYFRLQIL